ncbi:MAG: GGDEF domain-containing protein [Burkholderiales bacterium]|nr:GGDEF domain-containing protein [Burkholderiales bacterium]
MHVGMFYSRAAHWLGYGAAAWAVGCATAAAAEPATTLQRQVNQAVDLAYEEPLRGLATLRALDASPGRPAEQHRIIQAGIGLIAADHAMADDAAAAVDALERLSKEVGPLAHADALLVRADLEMEMGDTIQGSRDIVAAIGGYAPYCDAAMAADRLRCNDFDWFYANMFAGVTLDSAATRGTAGMYLQTAGAIAHRADRPDLEARAAIYSAQVAQEENNLEMSDRLLQRADVLATRSRDASAQEFVKMFIGFVRQDRNDLAGAQAQLEAAMAIASGAGHARRMVELAAFMSQLDMRQGRPERALQRIQRAMPQVEHGHLEGLKQQLVTNQVLALLQMHGVEEGRRVLRSLLDTLDARSTAADRGEIIGKLGNALAAAGDEDGAMKLFQREQQSLFAGRNKQFERTMLDRQAELGARQQAERRAELRRWAALGACVVALLLAATAAVSWMRLRNRRLARANDALRDQSERDPLTGLLNRDGLLRGLRERGRLDEFAGTLLLIDIDHFKNINDTLGHAGGDAVLREAAARLQACVREGDLVVRWGGEELVVAILSSPFDGDALVDRILHSLAASPIAFQQRTVSVSASIGYASFPLDGDAAPMTFDEALAVADAGMYYAKRNGRRAAVRIARLPRELLVDLGGLPAAVERGASRGSIELRVRRPATRDSAFAAAGLPAAALPS